MFLITVPFAVLVLVLGILVLPRHAGENVDPVDHPGGVLSVVMIASFVMAIVLLPQGVTPTVGALVAVAAVSGVLFVRREHRADNPLFDLHAAAVPTFWVAFVAGLVAFGALVGGMFIGQQFTQNVLGETPLVAVLLTLGLAVGMLPASVVGGGMVESRGTRVTFLAGLALIGAGFAEMLISWRPGTSLVWVVVAYLLVGVGIGLAATPVSRSLSASLPISKAGMSSASVDLTKDLGGAVFQALLGTLLAIAYSKYFSVGLRRAAAGGGPGAGQPGRAGDRVVVRGGGGGGQDTAVGGLDAVGRRRHAGLHRRQGGGDRLRAGLGPGRAGPGVVEVPAPG